MKKKQCFIAVFVFAVMNLAAYSETGPVAWWRFDEEGGESVRDHSGNEIHGILSGNVERVQGLAGGALSFPGEKTAFMEVPRQQKEKLDFPGSFSLAAWVQRTDTGTRWDGMICNGAYKKGYQVFYSENNQKLTLYIHTDEKPYHPVVGEYIPLDQWMHIAVVYDREAEKIYLYQNGKQTIESPCSGTLREYPDFFYLGASAHPFNAFRGILDEVRLYGRALKTGEIQEMVSEFAGQIPESQPVPKPVFQELHAQRTENGILFSFEMIEPGEKQSVNIYRNHHRFNNENPGVRGGALLFSGELRPDENGRFEYLDQKPVQPGMTYYYWVAPDSSNFRVFPAQVRIYHPEIWWTPERIQEKTRQLASRFPQLVEVKTIGRTVQGRPLKALYIGNRKKMLAFIGAVHVSESGPELILGAVEQLLQDSPELFEEVGITAVPCVTLDERERLLNTGYPRYLRKNAAGVDINRNFPAYWEELPPAGTMQTDDPEAEIYRGPAPGSEPETQALMAYLEEVEPLAAFFFHSLGSLCSAGFVSPKYAAQEGDEQYVDLVKKIARLYARGMYGEEYSDYFWHHQNSPQGGHNSWLYKNFRIPAMSLELDSNEQGQAVYSDGVTPQLLQEYVMRHKNAMKALMEAVIEEEIQRLGQKKEK
jgi:hypothetical protein